MNTDLEDSLIAWQGGELPPGRTDALLDKLRADATFRRLLAEQVWTLSLTKVAQAPDPRWLALHEEIGVVERRFGVLNGGFEESLMKTVRREPLRFVNAWWRWAATAAAAAAVVLAAALIFRQQQGLTTEVETLAVLVPASHTGQSRPISAGPLKIGQEQVRLLFANGVIVDVEGPADLRLLGLSRLLCREGKLRTSIPKGAEGFCVETPRGAVTDLGTELGISVTRNGETDVAVFEGQAELSVQMPGQAGTRTALLQVNEKAGFEPGTGEIRTSSEADFLRALQPLPPELNLPPDYGARIRSAEPVHYWPMDRSMDGVIPNEIVGGPALLMAGGAGIEARPPGRPSVRFRGREQPGVLHLERPWKAPAGGYAIEFWFMPDTLEQTALIALTTTDPVRPHLALVEVGGRRPGIPGTGILRYLLRWPAGHRDGINLYSPAATALPYQWHHVVAQHNSGQMQLYLDGESFGSAKGGAGTTPVDALINLGCLEYRPGQAISELRRPFSGRMAELAVYDRLLIAEEIAAHAKVP